MAEKKKSLPIGSIFGIALKSAKFAKFIKLFKMLKFTKILITVFSMLLSVLVYSFSMGPWFATGFVLMIFIHEMGHVIALIQKGHKASAPIFIPMLGAVIFSPRFNNPEEEAYVGYGGPLLGGIGALATFGLWAIMPEKHELLLMVSYTATFINLFNMIPIRPLDGGRITHLIGGWFKWIGLVSLLALSLLIKQPSMLLIWILVLDDVPMKPNFKLGVVATCWVSMVTLMFMGYSDQGFWIDALDICLATLISVAVYAKYKRYVPEEETEKIHTTLQVKMKWSLLYTLLVLALAGLMSIQQGYLPQAVLK